MTDQHGNEWYVNDTRGYIDAGPSCDECGACECEACDECGTPIHEMHPESCSFHADDLSDTCIGLSLAYVCLDGGESLCEACFDKSDIVFTDDKGEAYKAGE